MRMRVRSCYATCRKSQVSLPCAPDGRIAAQWHPSATLAGDHIGASCRQPLARSSFRIPASASKRCWRSSWRCRREVCDRALEPGSRSNSHFPNYWYRCAAAFPHRSVQVTNASSCRQATRQTGASSQTRLLFTPVCALPLERCSCLRCISPRVQARRQGRGVLHQAH